MKQLLLILALALTSCTANEKARSFGGTEVIELEPNERLQNVTWKETDLWILIKKDSAIPATTYLFKEKSTYGIYEGEIIIKEK